MPIAFFDLDRTLIAVNSGQLWVRYERKGGRIQLSQALRAGMWIFGYHLGFSRMEPILEEAIASLEGQGESELRDRTRHFYETEVRGTVRPGAARSLARHREQGDVLALLTSSSSYLSAEFQEQLGIPHACCNHFEVREGRFTGRPLGSLCFGAGKLAHARRLAAELGEDLRNASFYTDSYSDLPVMEEMGHPVAVNPDPSLARAARQRGWEVVDWGIP